MRAARAAVIVLLAAASACSAGEPQASNGVEASASHDPAPIRGTLRLLDRFDAWTIESPWKPWSSASSADSPRPEEGLAAAIEFDFERGLPAGLRDAALAAPLPGTPALRGKAPLAPVPAPQVVREAACTGAAGLRFERASGAAVAVVAVHPDTPHVFSARVRRSLEPGEFAAGATADEKARHAEALERDAGVGRIVLLELHQQPAADVTWPALLESFARRENALVATHVLPIVTTAGRGEWREARLELESSIFTRALVIGLLGGNPGWWRLEACARGEDDAVPSGSVDFDDVRLVELPAARWLATPGAVERDELPCSFGAEAQGSKIQADRRGFLRKVHLLGEARRALLAPPGTVASVPLVLPKGRFRLSFGFGVLEERRAGFGTKPIEFVATLEQEGRPPRRLMRASVTAAQSPQSSAWHDFRLEDVGSDGGNEGGTLVRLVLETRGDGSSGEVAVFGEPKLEPLLEPLVQPRDARGDRKPGDLPRNVVLVSVDTLRADRLGCLGYARPDGERTTPALDAFARECLLFANARTVAPYTLPSHATMFTGLPPRVHGVTRAGRRLTAGFHPLLPEAFAAAGHATAAFTGGAFLSYEHGFHLGFDRYSILDPFLTDEDPYREAFPRPGDRAWNDAAYAQHDLAAIERWLEAQSGRPFFLFVHTYVAHNYHPPKSVERRFVKGDPDATLGLARDLKLVDLRAAQDAANGGRVAADVARAASDLYDAAVAAADARVGELIGLLRGRGLLENTVVAIVSDHGEEFGEHGGLLHGRTLYEEMLRIPFLLRVPGVSPAIVKEPVDLCDLAPTLRDAAGIPADPRASGTSVLARRQDDRFEEAFWAEVTAPGLSRRYALATSSWKLIQSPATRFEEAEYAVRRPAEFELFELAKDPMEAVNLARGDAQGATSTLAALQRALGQRRVALNVRRAELMPDWRTLEFSASGDALRLLQGLGYATSAELGSDDESGDESGDESDGE